MLEDFLTGFLGGASFGETGECTASMQGLVTNGFDIINNRQIYDPSKIVKAIIAFQKFQQSQAVFYA